MIKRLINYRKSAKSIQVLCLVLFGISMFSGCKDYDDIKIVEIKSKEPALVKTEISFTISGVKSPQTRMSEEIVQGQEEPVFRGIQGIRLFAHITNEDNTTLWKEVFLPTVDPDNEHLSSNAVAQFYADVEVPLNTDGFRFYGEAKKTPGDGSERNGELVKPSEFPEDGLDNLTFGLKSINSSEDPKAEALANYLTVIAKELSEQGLSNGNDGPYDKIIKNTAGSSANVFALIRQLYTNIEDATAKDAVKVVIEGGKDPEVGKEQQYATVDGNTITFTDVLDGYPENLPDGTARMLWDETNNKFVVNTASSPILFDGADLSAYVYPPALYYYKDSGIRTSSTIHMYGYEDWLKARELGYFVNGKSDYDTSWKHFLDMYDYNTDEKVNAYSHSVALADEIRYAVSRLDVTIRAASSSLTDAAGRLVHFTASAFPITGILIGDQTEVNYKFEQDPEEAPAKKIIYDTDMPDGMILSTSKTPVNSTLVLESSAVQNAKTVKIAVEFENNSGYDIYGKAEEESAKPIIPHGTKFYLLGELDPSDAVQPTDDEQELQDRVFKKGAVTKVDFVVSNFQYAYNVVPDLRNPHLMLGLSANLNWQSGIIIPKEI